MATAARQKSLVAKTFGAPGTLGPSAAVSYTHLSLPAERDESRLLYAMGWETANMHLGSPQAIKDVKRDLAKRKNHWLHKTAKGMCKATLNDWEAWRRGWKKLAKS